MFEINKYIFLVFACKKRAFYCIMTLVINVVPQWRCKLGWKRFNKLVSLPCTRFQPNINAAMVLEVLKINVVTVRKTMPQQMQVEIKDFFFVQGVYSMLWFKLRQPFFSMTANMWLLFFINLLYKINAYYWQHLRWFCCGF